MTSARGKLSPENEERLQGVARAALAARQLSLEQKNEVLRAIARDLLSGQAKILAANHDDLKMLDASAAPAFRDRLALNEKRIQGMADSLRAVADLPNPVGEVVEARTLANGLKVRRERAPLGVILMIFESRPNVAVEAFSLAFKSGNAIILRGGKESMKTTAALYACIASALDQLGVAREVLWGIENPDRSLTEALLHRSDRIDVVVPRGGERLIEFVSEHARMPLIKNDRGLCHVYVHREANPHMAAEIVANAKCQRPGVCNAMETLLVDAEIAKTFLPIAHRRLSSFGVEWHCDEPSFELLSGSAGVTKAAEGDFDREYLDLKMSCRVVRGLDEALEHIQKHGSRHSEAIVTANEMVARAFLSSVDAAAAYWNASTRFTDGFELGLGGELGISTQKLHVRGPVGLRELTTPRWIIEGAGQVRA